MLFSIHEYSIIHSTINQAKTALSTTTRVRPMRRKRPMSMFRCFQPKIPMSDADVDFVYGSVVTAAGKMLSADAVAT